jgi:hypothetical protein
VARFYIKGASYRYGFTVVEYTFNSSTLDLAEAKAEAEAGAGAESDLRI